MWGIFYVVSIVGFMGVIFCGRGGMVWMLSVLSLVVEVEFYDVVVLYDVVFVFEVGFVFGMCFDDGVGFD